MAQWISIPRTEGVASRQAHTDLPRGCYERELGREGFYGPSTQMYHRHPPTGWSRIEGPLRPRAFDTDDIGVFSASPWGATPLLVNQRLALRLWRLRESMGQLVRNADGDELLFVHAGGGELYCDYGHLGIAEGDYVVLPRGTTWRVQVSGPMTALLLEATGGAYRLPDKGLVGQHAVFDPAVLDVPRIDAPFEAQRADTETHLAVKRRGRLSTLVYPYNPLDAVGWHGTLMPLRLNWRDIRPLMSHRYHLPPSAHTTFVTRGFVVCTFTPRPLESDPGALRVPFFHSNEDYDEVIFYHRGAFFSRDNIHPGRSPCTPAASPMAPTPRPSRPGSARGAARPRRWR
jgi:homogentisate 1,2-dioxygenase